MSWWDNFIKGAKTSFGMSGGLTTTEKLIANDARLYGMYTGMGLMGAPQRIAREKRDIDSINKQVKEFQEGQAEVAKSLGRQAVYDNPEKYTKMYTNWGKPSADKIGFSWATLAVVGVVVIGGVLLLR